MPTWEAYGHALPGRLRSTVPLRDGGSTAPVIRDLLLPVTLGNLALFAALSLLLTSKKLRRGREERASIARRTRYRVMLEAGGFREADREFERRAARDDLVAVLDVVYPALDARRREAVQQDGRASGLVDRELRRLRHRDPVVRGRAALLLGELRLPEAVPPLERLLTDPDFDVRHVAVRSLGLVATEEAAWALIRALGDGVMEPPRILEHLGRPWAVRSLLEAFHISDLAPVRATLAEALGLAGDGGAAAALAGLLAWGSEEERARVCRAMGRTGDARLVRFVVGALADGAWVVRAQAAAALALLGAGDADAVTELERGLRDRAWWVRSNCADALATSPAGRAALARAVDGPDRYAADRARETLALHAVHRPGGMEEVRAA